MKRKKLYIAMAIGYLISIIITFYVLNAASLLEMFFISHGILLLSAFILCVILIRKKNYEN